MKQIKTIDQLKYIIPTIAGIEVALLYGSFGRKEATPNSDIDLAIKRLKEWKHEHKTQNP